MHIRQLLPALIALLLCACASFDAQEQPGMPPEQARKLIVQLLPSHAKDREGWAQDLYAGFAAMQLPATAANFCAVIAVTEQEGGFAVDPAVPGLSKIAWREIEARAKRYHVPMALVRTALKVPSPTGDSFATRLDTVRTERELSAIYEDLIRYLPMGRTLLASSNPVRTGGPMQVGVRFAEQHAQRRPYPYPVDGTLRSEVFTRRGGMYFGVAHLFDYEPGYEHLLFHYADFNAGHYASRNAAFQQAVSLASGIPLELDGDLLAFKADGSPVPGRVGATELATRVLGERIRMSDKAIRKELERSREAAFTDSKLYRRVFEVADAASGRTLPRAVVPDIVLSSPKFTRKLTTRWFAERVQSRHEKCMQRAPAR